MRVVFDCHGVESNTVLFCNWSREVNQSVAKLKSTMVI